MVTIPAPATPFQYQQLEPVVLISVVVAQTVHSLIPLEHLMLNFTLVEYRLAVVNQVALPFGIVYPPPGTAPLDQAQI